MASQNVYAPGLTLQPSVITFLLTKAHPLQQIHPHDPVKD